MDRDEAIVWMKRAETVLQPLHRDVHALASHRDESEWARKKWSSQCNEFRTQHAALAYPGGWDQARERLRAGDQDALDFALHFIEFRPYFFRSGYMYMALLKCLNSVPMTPAQRGRYDAVKAAYREYRRRLKESRTG
jgi:hypothetical protein